MVLNCCYLCGDYLGLFSFQYYCNDCHIVRRLLLLNGKEKFIEKIREIFMNKLENKKESPQPLQLPEIKTQIIDELKEVFREKKNDTNSRSDARK